MIPYGQAVIRPRKPRLSPEGVKHKLGIVQLSFRLFFCLQSPFPINFFGPLGAPEER